LIKNPLAELHELMIQEVMLFRTGHSE